MRFALRLAARLLAAGSLVAATAARAASIEGNWQNPGKNGIVAIAPCGRGEICGRLMWVRIKPSDNNPQALDSRNPVPALRGRSLCGLTILWGFHADGADRWSGGAIYDPESGNTYSATMTLRPDGSLGLRGYVLMSLFGRSETWTRFVRPIPPCPAR